MGQFTYDLIQVETTEDGIVSSNVYKSKETISAADGWTKTYEKLPLTGKIKMEKMSHISTMFEKKKIKTMIQAI
ncbi:hypothetical protein RGT18_15650 [Solobacterium moorei]|nr:hypothetical protein RGT18_15650 [Solobacterium moorei]